MIFSEKKGYTRHALQGSQLNIMLFIVIFLIGVICFGEKLSPVALSEVAAVYKVCYGETHESPPDHYTPLSYATRARHLCRLIGSDIRQANNRVAIMRH
jgi:hypothetical protein